MDRISQAFNKGLAKLPDMGDKDQCLEVYFATESLDILWYVIKSQTVGEGGNRSNPITEKKHISTIKNEESKKMIKVYAGRRLIDWCHN